MLVPGVTDHPTIASGIARFAAGLGTVQRVELLPFHQLGKFKWERLGLEYTLPDVQAPSPQPVGRICGVFRQTGLSGY